MRILFVAPTYMGLCKNIEDELVRQKHDVVFIKDKPLLFNYRFQYHHNFLVKVRNQILKILSWIFVDYENYWDKQLNRLSDLYFDVLFVINGFSYDHSLLLKLQQHNPQINTRLYLWDNIYAYDFSNVVDDFETCFSLDYLDSIKYDKIDFLPAFWVDNNHREKICYDVFLVGSNHDDRYYISKRVVKQLRSFGLTYYIKLIDRFKLKNDIITHNYLSTNKYLKVMRMSKCILDTERPSQTGPTFRLIWALALGKKIISTNRYMKEMPFYNERQILIIDRKNPQIDKEFLSEEIDFSPCEYIVSLRIDNWVKTILK